jgi:ribonuclease HIII
VAQRTVVLKVPAARGAEIERRLLEQRFEFRSAPYALFSAKGEGVVVTHYTSGKFVVQGDHPETFVETYLGVACASPSAKPTPRAADPFAPQGSEVITIGSDESGKGDYFGPLIVAAVRVTPELSKKLEGGEVRDCKLMNDASVLRVGAALRANVPHAIARLDPPAYNAEHARVKNLNPMLAALHALAVRELLTGAEPGVRVVIDQFGNESLLRKALAGTAIQLEQRHRGEEELAVAAASVIAREQFLAALHELSEEYAIDLAKGAGSPVDAAARRFVQLHGPDKLGAVAKLHFKNTQKLGTLLR